MKVNLHRIFKHCTTLFVLTLLVTNCEKDIEIKNNPKQNNHSEQPQEINGITFLNVDTLLEDTDFQILQKNGVKVVKENNTHILITKEFSSPIYNDMIAKRYDGSKIIFSLTAVDNKNRFLDDNKQYDFTIDTALGIVYSNTQILTDLGIKNDNTAGKIAPVIRISYIYVTYEKSCDGTVNGVPQLHSYDNRSECSWNGSSKGPQRWTQVFVVSGSGLSTQGYNYNHYSDNNDDGPGGSSFVPFGGTPKIFVRNISKVGEAILVPYVLNFPQTVSDFIKEDPVFVSFLFKYLNYNGFTNDGIQVAHHWVQKYHDTSDMVYFDKIVELAKAAAADVHSLITFLELDDEQTYWIMDNAGVRNQLIAFAKANNTPQAKAFAVEALKALMDGGEVDFDDQIINELTGKALCIYEKIKTSSTGFKNAIKKFEPEFPVAHLKFDMGDIEPSRGKTIAPNSNPVTPNSPDYVITIRLNNTSSVNSVTKRPNLLVAKTIAHEVIHAEMYRKLLSVLDNGGNIDGVTRQDVLEALNGNYPGLYDYYRRHKNWQHAQMATHYRESLARILQEYDTGIAVPNNQQPSQLYMDLAWEGLRYADIPTWNDLPQTEKDRVNDVISDYVNDNQNETCTE